jgi:predicted nucleic acid-binding protein
MILLDTNVISEMMKAEPDLAVTAWFRTQHNDDLFITTLSVAEIEYGISLLPEGRRRQQLANAARLMFATVFADKIMPFDHRAARHYAWVHARRKAAGKTISVIDAELAAICKSAAATLATRNTRDFTDLDLSLINPWDFP